MNQTKPKRNINEHLGIITWLEDGSFFGSLGLYMSSWSLTQNSCKNPCGYWLNSENTETYNSDNSMI